MFALRQKLCCIHESLTCKYGSKIVPVKWFDDSCLSEGCFFRQQSSAFLFTPNLSRLGLRLSNFEAEDEH